MPVGNAVADLLAQMGRVGGDEIREESEGAGPVRECVEHLEDDPPIVVYHAEEQIPSIHLIKRRARVLRIGRHDRAEVATLQVVPEDPSAKHRVI